MNLADLTPRSAIGGAWVVWLASWFAAAIWSQPTVARPGFVRELPNRLVTVAGGVLLFRSLGGAQPLIAAQWPVAETFGWIMFAGVVAGIAFAWWARLHLGPLWSGTVTRKQDHRIVDTGPYAIVRHPIYTGLLFALLATALQRGAVDALVGAALVWAGLWLKAQLEEGFLAQELGGADYAAYRARVPMLVPFLKGSAP